MRGGGGGGLAETGGVCSPIHLESASLVITTNHHQVLPDELAVWHSMVCTKPPRPPPRIGAAPGGEGASAAASADGDGSSVHRLLPPLQDAGGATINVVEKYRLARLKANEAEIARLQAAAEAPGPNEALAAAAAAAAAAAGGGSSGGGAADGTVFDSAASGRETDTAKPDPVQSRMVKKRVGGGYVYVSVPVTADASGAQVLRGVVQKAGAGGAAGLRGPYRKI